MNQFSYPSEADTELNAIDSCVYIAGHELNNALMQVYKHKTRTKKTGRLKIEKELESIKDRLDRLRCNFFDLQFLEDDNG